MKNNENGLKVKKVISSLVTIPGALVGSAIGLVYGIAHAAAITGWTFIDQEFKAGLDAQLEVANSTITDLLIQDVWSKTESGYDYGADIVTPVAEGAASLIGAQGMPVVSAIGAAYAASYMGGLMANLPVMAGTGAVIGYYMSSGDAAVNYKLVLGTALAFSASSYAAAVASYIGKMIISHPIVIAAVAGAATGHYTSGYYISPDDSIIDYCQVVLGTATIFAAPSLILPLISFLIPSFMSHCAPANAISYVGELMVDNSIIIAAEAGAVIGYCISPDDSPINYNHVLGTAIVFSASSLVISAAPAFVPNVLAAGVGFAVYMDVSSHNDELLDFFGFDT